MAFVSLEDSSSKAEVVLFPKTFQKVGHLLSQHHVFVVRGAIDLTSPHLCKIKANEFVPMDLFFEQWPAFSKLCLLLPSAIEESMLQELQSKLPKGKIPLHFQFSEQNKKLELATRHRVGITRESLMELDRQKIGVSIYL